MKDSIQVVLVDDHTIVRKGLKSLLSNHKSIRVVAEASDGNEALCYITNQCPDLVLCDINMPNLDGISLARKIQEIPLSCDVLILSMYPDESYILEAIEAGVKGYLPKSIHPEKIIEAIHTIYNGQTFFSAEITQVITQSLLQSYRRKVQLKTMEDLTNRETEVLKNIVHGESNKEIAQSLYISIRTVDTHRNNIMRKLKARNTADMVRKAIVNNLI
jgi:two-component system nitrate/nitrite response regulator NarL